MNGSIMPVAEPVEAIRAINDRQVFLTVCLLMSGLSPIDNQYVRNSCQSIWNGRNVHQVYYEIVANHAGLLNGCLCNDSVKNTKI